MRDIIVYGKGKTGIGLQKMLTSLGKSFRFYDDYEGFESGGSFSPESLVIIAPGVKPNAPGIVAAKNAGATIVGELDFCFPYCKSPCVSVTGTNGKTTTCRLIYHILTSVGKSARLLGNGGVPFSQEVLETSSDEVTVLECSSFQLHESHIFSPFISVITNIAPDHLDYHGDFSDYIRAKCNNFAHQPSDGYALFNADDKTVLEVSSACPCHALFYSVNNGNTNCHYDGSAIHIDCFGKSVTLPNKFLATLAPHNLSNALCAILACYLLGVPAEDSCKAIATYKNLPHRLQTISVFDGVTFVDDSKATNVHATLGALACFTKVPLALILGGSDKGCAFDEIFCNLGTNVKIVCAVGETAAKIVETAKDYSIDVRLCQTYRQAVELCYNQIKNIGGVVLMSNACASFDMFDGYARRGEHFAALVEALSREKKTD